MRNIKKKKQGILWNNLIEQINLQIFKFANIEIKCNE